jgi:acetyl-CoA carboxylase biotin carboxyl carrier protein
MAEHVVQSPLPGIFYRRPAPEQPPFAEVGSAVMAGQTIGLVEVMKQFAEIKAGVSGTLTDFSVDNMAVLGPGDSIATIETS